MGVRRIAIAVRVSVKTVCVSVLVLKLRNCLTKQHQVQLRWRGGGGQTNSLRCDNNCEHKSFDNTRPKPAYGRQGLDWIVGPGYSLIKKRDVTHGGPQLTSLIKNRDVTHGGPQLTSFD